MDNKYFAAKEAKETAGVLLKKVDSWSTSLIGNGYLAKAKKSWAAYYGIFYSDFSDSHQVSFGGEQGELSLLPVNQYRNIATHLINMITANRPSMEAMAINTDYKSLSQAVLANGLLEYYMKQKKLEEFFKKAVESGVILGEGYVKLSWNSTRGQPFIQDPDTGEVIYEGDLEFDNLSPFDVIRDTNKSDSDHDWLCVRTNMNKYDLMAKYPDLAEKIQNTNPPEYYQALRFNVAASDEDSDLIPVYEFFHKPTESLPEGRYMLFTSSDTVMIDMAMPYRVIPVFKMSQGDILGTSFGYTPMFDILPIQDALNSLYSTVLTNQTTFGVQNVLVPRGGDITVAELLGGLNLVEYTPGIGKPEALNLTSTPPEIFNFMKQLEGLVETLSGVNSVVRGNPEANLRSGNALALIQAQAVMFASGLQQSYVLMMEEVGTAIIKILQDFAKAPRIAAIAGKANKMELREFTSDDLVAIDRVRVGVSNPMSKTVAGRLEIANNLLQMGLITNPKHYFTVLHTGNLDTMIEGEEQELLLIRKENEWLMDGKVPVVTPIDSHNIHINEHKAVLADPESRQNPELVQAALDHIQQHIDALRNTDPALLQMVNQQPLPPLDQMGAQPPEGEMPPGPEGMTQEQAGAAENNLGTMQQPLPVGVEQAQAISQPMVPEAPQFGPNGEPLDPRLLGQA
jgi:hypothetical protein